ncbi:MAG: beta-galactosidase [Lactobacillus sp.]|nr:beta-galactosidase [Lactobacillus sp.]
MDNLKVQEDKLYLDGQEFKLLSGAIHYFRVPRANWRRSLFNLKALGFNTVETYTAWNLHEPRAGEFDFTGQLDLGAFIKLAQELGLNVIVRPSPYICAEWEFGGLPAWLLNLQGVRLRANDPTYLACVERYYRELFKILVPLQRSYGGPIMMMQIENEYGSYGEDKSYLRSIKALMEKFGIDVPLFTADGAWRATLRAGSLLEDNVLATGNFGSHAKENFAQMRAYQAELGVKQPLLCMEFWDGWFSRWGKPVVKRDQAELLDALREVLLLGEGVNLYMFHGGTNFGFMNGCSARLEHDLPQITAYDYGAPLNEVGDPTPTYFMIQDLIHELYPELKQATPLYSQKIERLQIPLSHKTSLFGNLHHVTSRTDSQYPQTMETVGQFYGYLLYRTHIERDTLATEKLRVIDARDRVQVYVEEQHEKTQYQEEIGAPIEVKLPQKYNQLDILVENMGRVNYGSKLTAQTQQKGIRTGVMVDLHFVSDWQQYALDLSKLAQLDYKRPYLQQTPSFYKYTFDLAKTGDCYLDLTHFGKGVALLNGHNLGRFWQVGPQLALFCPASFFEVGKNEIVIFETEGKYCDTIDLVKEPIYKQLRSEQ